MRYLFSLLLILFALKANAQNHTYLGAEAGLPFDVYKANDPGKQLQNKPFFWSPMFGFTLGQEFCKHFTVETGVYRTYYGASYKFKGQYGQLTYNAYDAWQVPFRLRGRIGFAEDKIRLSGTLGLSYTHNSDYGSLGYSWIDIYRPGDTLSVHDFKDNQLQQNFFLLEGSLGLEFKLHNAMLISLSSGYYKGFKKVIDMEVTYQAGSSPVRSATLYSNGDYFNFMLGLRYPLDVFWKKASL